MPTAIADVLIIEPKVFGDSRGFFYESFNQEAFNRATGTNVQFVQDNHSRSAKGVLRGLHYQLPPFAQGKLVRVTQGTVYDVSVDLRAKSPTFGQHVGIELSAENQRMLWIPEGFAHGFLTISETSEFLYKATAYYASTAERSILWSDAHIGVNWPLSGIPSLSEKDQRGDSLANAARFYD